jgi:hypothetical protein
VRGHAWALRELVRNLLHNALKHSPAGGALGVRLVVADGDARLTVADSGPGIAAALRPRLMQPFVGGGGPGSTGLGLAICLEIVQQLGGRLALDNRPAAGGGTAGLDAVVHLPLAAGPAAPPPGDNPPDEPHPTCRQTRAGRHAAGQMAVGRPLLQDPGAGGRRHRQGPGQVNGQVAKPSRDVRPQDPWWSARAR